MFQFGEILTLAICIVTIAYVLANWRRIQLLPALKPFVGPFLFLVVAWFATVIEGLFIEGPNIPILVLGQESIGVAHQSPYSELLNLAEHVGYAVAGIWMFLLVRRCFRNPGRAAA